MYDVSKLGFLPMVPCMCFFQKDPTPSAAPFCQLGRWSKPRKVAPAPEVNGPNPIRVKLQQDVNQSQGLSLVHKPPAPTFLQDVTSIRSLIQVEATGSRLICFAPRAPWAARHGS